MSSTIDNINTNIVTKADSLKQILQIFSGYELDPADTKLTKQLTTQLSELIDNYTYGSIRILQKYYEFINKPNTDSTNINYIYSEYIKFINYENTIGKLKRIYSLVKRIYRTYEISDVELTKLLNTYDYSEVVIDCNDKINSVCSCDGAQQRIEPKTSESVCHKCGISEKLYGVVFEDEQFFFQEGQRTKHGKYDPTKHCKFWLDRIQAKESAEIPDSLISKIVHCMVRDNIWSEKLVCNVVRKYLKELNKTQYNDHAALIRKKVTKIEPSQLTEYETKLVFVYFARAVQIYNRIKQESKSNCPYHPFFIYKIIEHILNKSEDECRKNDILSCIHLQSRDTLIENDRIWEMICPEIAGFKYQPTNPN